MKDSETTAEGPPHVRATTGDEARAGVTAGAKRRQPQGAGACAQRLGTQRKTRATSRKDGSSPTSVGSVQGDGAAWGNNSALAASRLSAELNEPRGRLRSDDDARC